MRSRRRVVQRETVKADADISRIIAMMLGRLRMDIEQCIRIYGELGTKIFAKKQPLSFLGRNRYDYEKLEQLVKDIARDQSGLHPEGKDPDGPMLYDPGVVNNADELTVRETTRNRFVPCRV